MDYVVLYICFLKVPVGAMTKSFGGEYNCIFRTGCQNAHIAVLLIHKLGHMISKSQNSTRLSRPYGGCGSAGKLPFIMLVL